MNIEERVLTGSKVFDVEIGSVTVRAETHIEAAEKAARWLTLHAAADLVYSVGDMAELNDPIHPHMSHHLVRIDAGEGSLIT